MSVDLEAVRRAGRRGAQMPAQPSKGHPGPITRTHFARAVVAAFDQSLNGCALVVLDGRGVTQDVMRARKFETTAQGLDGYEAYYHRAEQLEDQLGEEMGKLARSFPGLVVVHEAPPMGGGKFIEAKSSLMAGREVRRAARRAGVPFAGMVSPQAHKIMVTRDQKATKADVLRLLPGFAASVGVTGYNLVKNQDLRDALCIALYHLHALHRQGAA